MLLKCSRGHGAAMQHLKNKRTLIGENHGLAVTLTHGGLQLEWVWASLIMHPDRCGTA